MKEKFAVVIILYEELPKKYIWELKHLSIVIVDNTDNRDLHITGDNLVYIPLGHNYGIAKALNVGFEEAKKLGVKWVLTMDQDSDYPYGMLDKYYDFVKNIHDNVGLVCPRLNVFAGENRLPTDSYVEICEALTSGSFISMQAYDTVGGFKEELFIDEVDFEFCRNIKRNGFKIYQLNSVVMQHQLGKTEEFKLMGKHLFYVTHHNYIRHYYMQRNGLYVKKLYPEFTTGKFLFFVWLKPIMKILLFEKDKIRKIKARYYGWLDYKNNKMGALDRKL